MVIVTISRTSIAISLTFRSSTVDVGLPFVPWLSTEEDNIDGGAGEC